MALDPAVETGIAVHQQAEFHQADLGAFAEFRAVELEQQVAGQHGLFAEQDVRWQVEHGIERGHAVEFALFRVAVSTAFDQVFGKSAHLLVVAQHGAGIDGDLADFGGFDGSRLAAEFG